VFFITPDANGIHGEPEITGCPIFDREITLAFRAMLGADSSRELAAQLRRLDCGGYEGHPLI
jgi:hypothetical protein